MNLAASHLTNRSLILICEEEAFHLHSTDGKNTNSHKVSELSLHKRKQILVLSCIACMQNKKVTKISPKNS